MTFIDENNKEYETIEEYIDSLPPPTWKDKIRWFFTRDLPDSYWWFVHRLIPKHRYHMIRTGLKPGYHDPCVRLICAIMEETVMYVDLAGKMFVWDDDDLHCQAWKAYTNAANFWKENKERFLDGMADDDYEKIWDDARRLSSQVILWSEGMWY